jgi:hypothetical protein
MEPVSNKPLIIPVQHQQQQQQQQNQRAQQPKDLNEDDKIKTKEDFQKWFYPNTDGGETNAAKTGSDKKGIEIKRKENRASASPSGVQVSNKQNRMHNFVFLLNKEQNLDIESHFKTQYIKFLQVGLW